MEASSALALYFWTPIKTHCSTQYCTCVFIYSGKAYAGTQGLQKPRIRFIETQTLCILGKMPISTVNRSQHLNNGG